MLFFTETGWTLPDMKEISAQFDRDYDQDKYEQKIASIAANVRASFGDKAQQMAWDSALEKLSRGDRYLSVLIGGANPTGKGARRYLRMLVAALVFLALAFLDLQFSQWLRDH